MSVPLIMIGDVHMSNSVVTADSRLSAKEVLIDVFSTKETMGLLQMGEYIIIKRGHVDIPQD